MKKILLICNESDFVINFRKELIFFLKNNGFDSYVICADSKRKEEIEQFATKCFVAPLGNRSKNPFKIIKSIKIVKKITRNLKPDVVFTFQIKPNIIGTIGAKKAGCKNIFSMVEGLGDPFQYSTFKWKIIRFIVCVLLRKGFRFCSKVFVLNNDDLLELSNRKIVSKEKIVLLHSIGINCDSYCNSSKSVDEKHVVKLARLIKSKGIIDFCEVARKVRKFRSDIYFDLYGAEAELTKKDIIDYINDGSINYFGYVKNVAEVLQSSKMLVSTSYYREGFPRTILEAMASSKPVIATNTVGNKDAVIDNETGFLFPIHDVDGIARKIIDIIDDDILLKKLGDNARKVCLEKYDSDKINRFIVRTISENTK